MKITALSEGWCNTYVDIGDSTTVERFVVSGVTVPDVIVVHDGRAGLPAEPHGLDDGDWARFPGGLAVYRLSGPLEDQTPFRLYDVAKASDESWVKPDHVIVSVFSRVTCEFELRILCSDDPIPKLVWRA